MNITLNLTHVDVEKAIAAYVKDQGYPLDENEADINFQVDGDSIGATIEVVMSPTNTASPKKETAVKKTRVRRSREQIDIDDAKKAQDKADEAQGIAEAVGARNAEDKGSPELETSEEVDEEKTDSDEPEQGDIKDLDKGQPKVASSTESLFSTD